MSSSFLYEHDFHAWANEQSALLRAGRLSEADIGHIAWFAQIMTDDFWPGDEA